jgi:DNA-binding NarL/FixJ family response regulator
MSAYETEPLGTLSSREQQVAALVSDGLSNKTIARQLDLTEGTVKQHVHNILLKVGAHNRAQLTLLMIREDHEIEQTEWAGSDLVIDT